MPVLPSSTQTVLPQISAKSIIKRALRLIGAKQTNEDPSPSELQDGLEALNAMLDSWNTEKLVIYAVLRRTFAMTASQNGHVMGASEDFDAPVPRKVEAGTVGIIPVNQTLELPLRLLTDREYADRADKVTTGQPSAVWYDGNGTFYFYMIPDAAHTFVLYDDVQLSQISDVAEQFTLPTGFKRALDYNLAVELAPEWGTALANLQDVVPTAITAKADLKRLHIKPRSMRCDSALAPRFGNIYNIYTNEPN